MVYAKCLDIRKDKNNNYVFTLKTNSDEILEVDSLYINRHINNEDLWVINLTMTENKWIYAWDISSIGQYRLLESPLESEESNKVAAKSFIIGENTFIDGSDEIQQKSNNSLVITDRATVVTRNLRAKEAIFVGNKALRSDLDRSFEHLGNSDNMRIIRCRYAIIKNRCIFSNLILNSDIIIRSKRIRLSHSFIDINTVNEVLVLLDYIMNHMWAYYYTETLIQVDFNKYEIQAEAVVDRTIKILKNKMYRNNETIQKELKSSDTIMWDSMQVYTSFMPYASLACSMFISTGYKYEELLEQAELCLYDEERKDKNHKNRTEIISLKSMINNLYNGMRF